MKIRISALIEQLPNGDDARAVLRIVLEATFVAPDVEPVPPNPNLCPNCDMPVDSIRSPYCGDLCRDQAALVRQIRAGLDGALSDEERQIAVGQSLWHHLGGGYPLRTGLMTEKAIQAVIRRDKEACQECGQPATTVDHLRTGCNRPINLRAVCESCNQDRPFGDPDIVASEIYQTRLTELAARIGAEKPVRCCDDAATWDWRAYVRLRSQ